MSRYRAEIREWFFDLDGNLVGTCYGDALDIFFDGDTITIMKEEIKDTELIRGTLFVTTNNSLYRCIDKKALA